MSASTLSEEERQAQVDAVSARLRDLGFKSLETPNQPRRSWPQASNEAPPAATTPFTFPGIFGKPAQILPPFLEEGASKPDAPQPGPTPSFASAFATEVNSPSAVEAPLLATHASSFFVDRPKAKEVPPTPRPPKVMEVPQSTAGTLFTSPGNVGSPGGSPKAERRRMFSFRGKKSTLSRATVDKEVAEAEAGGWTVEWIALEQLLESADYFLGSEATGAASAHGHVARQEAAAKLIANHENVLKDVTNASSTTNIEGKPLTQTELKRVAPELRDHVDECMREVVRRLLGERAAVHQLASRLDPKNVSQCAAWIGTALYLDGRIQASPGEKPGRTPDLMPAAAAAMRAVLMEVSQEAVTTTLASSSCKWDALLGMLDGGCVIFAAEGAGAAAAHAPRHREEAARKLITNHHLVLKDVCNPTSNDVQYGNPLTQLDLQRVPPEHAFYVDECLREVARRLLGERQGSRVLAAHLDAANSAQLSAWIGCATYLEKRIQSHPDEKPGRTPDMSQLAAEAMRAVLKEVSTAAMSCGSVPKGHDRWKTLKTLLDKGAGLFTTQADGIAASHSHHARFEAARRLVTNHDNVLKDVCNPSEKNNIEGKPLTQTELTRVETELTEHVDAFLREVTRRLLGRLAGIHRLEEHVDPADIAACRAWRLAAVYLNGRIQSGPDEKPGRTPDMGGLAANAMRAVMHEVGHVGVSATIREGAAAWGALHKMAHAEAPIPSEADGLAAVHSHVARQEAAAKLIANHENVLKDVTNASSTTNIEGKPLTQTELTRVLPELALYVDQAMREAVRRLLGRRAGSKQIEEVPDPTNDAQVGAWVQTAMYLDGRIHSHPDEKPGRTPDMSPLAAAAMRAVLREVSLAGAEATLALSTPRWAALHHLATMEGSFNNKNAGMDGAARDHSHGAREEAALKLIANRELVLKDIVNPTLRDVTNARDLTQLELKRVAPAHVYHVDDFMRELVRRLLCHRPGTEQMRERAEGDVVGIWHQAATYLDGRIQGSAEEKPGRTPDMPENCAAAMRAVLKELGGQSDGSMSGSRAGEGSLSIFSIGGLFSRAGKKRRNSITLQRATTHAEAPRVLDAVASPAKPTSSPAFQRITERRRSWTASME